MSATPLDTTAAAQITITAKQAFQFGTLPWFGPEIKGMFVRIKVSAHSHMWTKVVEATNILKKPEQEEDEVAPDGNLVKKKTIPGGIYTWCPPKAPGSSSAASMSHAKQFALYLRVDRLTEPHQLVPLTNISNSAPLASEIQEYTEHVVINGEHNAILNLPTADRAESLKQNFELRVAKRTMDAEDARAVLALNQSLKFLHNPGSTVSLNTVGLNNDLVRRTVTKETTQLVKGDEDFATTEEKLLAETKQYVDGLSAGGGGSFAGSPTQGMGSPQQTQVFGRSSSNLENFTSSQTPRFGASQSQAHASLTSPSQQTYGRDEASFEDEVRLSNRQMQTQVAERTKEQEYLVNLTERNKADNRKWILTGDHYEKQAARRFNLDEGKSLWEINDAKRKVLCDRYDDRKEKKGGGGGGGGGGAGGSAANGPRSLEDPDVLLEHCLSVRRSAQQQKQANAAAAGNNSPTSDSEPAVLQRLTTPTAGGAPKSPVFTSPTGSFIKSGAVGMIRQSSRPAALLARRSNSSILLSASSASPIETIDAQRGKRARSAGEV